MEVLHTLVIELVMLVVLAAFLELLIPAGDLSRYVRMVLGLLIIVAVLQAATGFWQRGRVPDFGALSLQSPSATFAGDRALEAGQRRWEENRAAALDSYRDGLARQIMALAALNPDTEIGEVVVELNLDGVREPMGSIRGVTLVPAPAVEKHGEGSVSWAEEEARKVSLERLCRTVAEFYGLEPERVRYKR